MSKQQRPKSRGPQLAFTDRALFDLTQILEYTEETWGKRTANKYRDKFASAFDRLKGHPEFLQQFPEIHEGVRFYRVEKHLLVCEVIRKRDIIVLAIPHASMDLPKRMKDLLPQLSAEIELLRKRFINSRKSSR